MPSNKKLLGIGISGKNTIWKQLKYNLSAQSDQSQWRDAYTLLQSLLCLLLIQKIRFDLNRYSTKVWFWSRK